MIDAIPTTERAVMAFVLAPALYLLTVGAGRWLKRRAGVRLGILYQAFCVVLALTLALDFFDLDFPSARPAQGAPFDLQRELGSLAILLGAVSVIALMRRFLWEIYFAGKRKTEIPKFLQEVAAIFVFLVAVLWVMGFSYHQTIPGLLAGSGIAAVILGIAMQDMLGNIIAGLAIEFGKPFKPGDWLVVDKYTAEVMEVTWRSTRLRTNDHICVEIPNNQLVKQPIINLCYPTRMHAMRLRVGIEYKTPPNAVRETLMKAAVRAKGVASNPPPKIFLVEFADSAVIYEIKFSLEDHTLYNEIVDNIQTNVWYALNREGIRIPFPIRTLKIDRKADEPHSVTTEIRSSLRQRPFFQCLDEEQTDRLISGANYCRFGRGETLIEQGAEGNSMFILANGSANVYVDRNHEQTLVATLRSGDYFGEMSLLTGEKRSATVIARSDCDVLEVGKAEFGKIVQESQVLLEKLSDLLAQRRLEVEGVLASAVEDKALISRQQEYKAGFLAKLASIFEL